MRGREAPPLLDHRGRVMSTRGQEVWKGHVSTFYWTTRCLNAAQGAYKYEIFLSDFSVINSLRGRNSFGTDS